MDTCTVAVPDVISAFAVPNPGVSSQSCRFFRVWPSSRSPRPTHHPAYFGLATIMKPNLSAIDRASLAHLAKLSTPLFCATSGVAADPLSLQIARQSRLLGGREGIRRNVDFGVLWKSFHEMNTKEPWKALDAVNRFPAWCSQGVEK